MTEPVDLVLEPLNRMDAKLGRIDEPLAWMEGNQRSLMEELRVPKSVIAGALHSQSFHDASLAESTDRIERRLELRENQ